MVRHKVIFAFILREFKTRFGAERMGYLWLFLEPLFHVAILSVVFGFAGKVIGDGIPYPVFVMLGILPWLLFSNIIKRGMSSVQGNRALLIYPPVNMIDPFVSRVLVEMIITVMIFTIIMLSFPLLRFFQLVDFTVDFRSMGMFVLLFVLFMLFSASLSLIAMVMSENFSSAQKVINLFIRPLYFLSGIFYTIKVVPQEYQWFFDYNPISNLMERFRIYFFNGYTSNFYDVIYLVELTVVFMFFGLFLYAYNLKRRLL
jgi:capsular polysaccharide transport system permease protein